MVKHTSLRTVRIGVLCSILAMLALFFFPFSVSAQATHSNLSPSKTPTVKIIAENGSFNFDPSGVTVFTGGSITFNNKTGKDQVVEYKNAPLFDIAPKQMMTFTVTLTKGKYRLRLVSNPKAHLVLTVK